MDSDEWDNRYEGTELLWTARPNRFVVEEVEGLAPGRAIDVGTGEGRNAVWLAERGWEVIGVDFSDVALDKARRLAVARGVEVEWVSADLLRYEPEAGGFDLVLVVYLHLVTPDLEAVLRRAVRALRPGGVLLIVGHDRRNLTDGHGGPQDPALLYDAGELAGRLSELQIKRAEPVTRPVETDEGTVLAIDTLVRAVKPATAADV